MVVCKLDSLNAYNHGGFQGGDQGEMGGTRYKLHFDGYYHFLDLG